MTLAMLVNVTSALSCFHPTGYSVILDSLLFIVIFTLSLFQNVFILYILYKLVEFRTASNVFIGCISMADLFVSFVPLPIAFFVYVCSWQQDETSRTVYSIIDIMSSTISITSLTAIACDRYYVILHPYRHERYMTIGYALMLCCFVWSYGILCGFLKLVIPSSPYTLFIVLAAYALPTLVMLITYIRIAAVAKRHAKQIFNVENRADFARRAKESFIKKLSRSKKKKQSMSGSVSVDIDLDSSAGMNKFISRLKNNKQKWSTISENGSSTSTLAFDSKVHPWVNNGFKLLPLRTRQNSDIAVIPEGENCSSNVDEASNSMCDVNVDILSQNQRYEALLLETNPATEVPANSDVQNSDSHSFDQLRHYRYLKRQSTGTSSSSGSTLSSSSIISNQLTFKKFADRKIKVRRNTSFLRRETLKVVSHIRRLRRELKASLMLAIVMAIFLCLWTPFIAMNIKYYAGTFDFSPDSNHLTMFKYFKILHYSNSAFNPLCYILVNSKWRIAFKRVLFQRKRKGRIHPK